MKVERTRTPRHPHRLAFAGLLVGNAALAFGPWLVRVADTGPVAAGFWRLALAAPLLALLGKAVGQPVRWPGRALFTVIAFAALFFAADLAAWHIGIRLTKLANATLFGNVGSFLFAGYGLFLARQRPGAAQLGSLLLAAAGSVLLMVDSAELGTAHLRGDLLAMLAGLFYGLYLILVERSRPKISPVPLLVIASIVGAAILLPHGDRDWRASRAPELDAARRAGDRFPVRRSGTARLRHRRSVAARRWPGAADPACDLGDDRLDRPMASG